MAKFIAMAIFLAVIWTIEKNTHGEKSTLVTQTEQNKFVTTVVLSLFRFCLCERLRQLLQRQLPPHHCARENFTNRDAAGSPLMLLMCTSAHERRAGVRHQLRRSAAIGKGY
jgi:hypothetical protein